MARRAKPELALPTVWQCAAERQWLCPLAEWRYGWRQKNRLERFLTQERSDGGPTGHFAGQQNVKKSPLN